MSHEYTYDISMFRDTFETRFTYLNGFLRNVSRFGSRPALFDPHSGRRWTYRELNAEANRLAHALRADASARTMLSCSPCSIRRSLFSAIWRRTRLVRSRVRSTTGRAQARLHSSLMTARPSFHLRRRVRRAVRRCARPVREQACHQDRCRRRRCRTCRSGALCGLRCRSAGERPADRLRPAHLRRDHPSVHLRHNQPSEGCADQQYQRGAFRA